MICMMKEIVLFCVLFCVEWWINIVLSSRHIIVSDALVAYYVWVLLTLLLYIRSSPLLVLVILIHKV